MTSHEKPPDQRLRHRTVRAARAAVVVAAIATLAAPPTSSTASATSPAETADGSGYARPCFIVQSRWNVALDGPQPTCETPVWTRSARD